MNGKTFLVFSVIALFAAALITAAILNQRIPMDPGYTGNLAGNLHNGGLFFEMDGKVYFSYSGDNNCLYSMNVDESKPKRLTSMGSKYISGAGGYIYFYMDSTKKSGNVTGLGAASNQYGIYRCNTKGTKQKCLVRDFCGEMQLCGEYIFYQIKTNGGSLHKIRLDKGDKQQVAEEMISPICYKDGLIYYTGVSADHDIHALSTTNPDFNTVIQRGHCFFPVVMNEYLYYLNGDANYSIWRTNLYTGEQEVVVRDRVDCFTLDSEHIYYAYSSESEPSLRRCDLDGSNIFILFDGVVNSINVTSKYLYFKTYGNDDVTYHMPLDGSRVPTIFVIKQ